MINFSNILDWPHAQPLTYSSLTELTLGIWKEDAREPEENKCWYRPENDLKFEYTLWPTHRSISNELNCANAVFKHSLFWFLLPFILHHCLFLLPGHCFLVPINHGYYWDPDVILRNILRWSSFIFRFSFLRKNFIPIEQSDFINHCLRTKNREIGYPKWQFQDVWHSKIDSLKNAKNGAHILDLVPWFSTIVSLCKLRISQHNSQLLCYLCPCYVCWYFHGKK